MIRQKTQLVVMIGGGIIAAVVMAAIVAVIPLRTTAQAQGVEGNPNATVPPEAIEPQAQQARPVEDIITDNGLGAESIYSEFEYVPFSAFRHDGASPASGYLSSPTVGFIRNNSAATMCLAAPVYVPNGATLTRFVMYVLDDNAANGIAAILWRQNQASPGPAEVVASLNFNEDSPSTIWEVYTTAIASGKQVVNGDFGYSITFCFADNTSIEQLIFAFKVEHTP